MDDPNLLCYMRELGKAKKIIMASLPLLQDALTALERGKTHITAEYVQIVIDDLAKLVARSEQGR